MTLLVFAAALLWLVKLVLQRDLGHWGPRLASRLVGLAVRIHPERRREVREEEWRAILADIDAEPVGERPTGLVFALGTILSGVTARGRDTWSRARAGELDSRTSEGLTLAFGVLGFMLPFAGDSPFARTVAVGAAAAYWLGRVLSGHDAVLMISAPLGGAVAGAAFGEMTVWHGMWKGCLVALALYVAFLVICAAVVPRAPHGRDRVLVVPAMLIAGVVGGAVVGPSPLGGARYALLVVAMMAVPSVIHRFVLTPGLSRLRYVIGFAAIGATVGGLVPLVAFGSPAGVSFAVAACLAAVGGCTGWLDGRRAANDFHAVVHGPVSPEPGAGRASGTTT